MLKRIVDVHIAQIDNFTFDIAHNKQNFNLSADKTPYFEDITFRVMILYNTP